LITNLLVGLLDISTVCGNSENCLCWLIILLDILAIFYLVFVSFYKVTKFVRMIGWIWIGVLLTADVIIVAIHPCILTLLCILFTMMIMAAMLSVVLPNVACEERIEQKEDGEKPKKKEQKTGSYVIREIEGNTFCFELYDKQDKFLVRSLNHYKTLADVKQAIIDTRRNGEIAATEDRTVSWIKEVNHPKFEMCNDNYAYYFKFSIDNKSVMFKSEMYKTVLECKKQLDKTIAAIKSYGVYISVDKLICSDAEQYKDKKPVSYQQKIVPLETVEETAVETTQEKEIEAQPTIDESKQNNGAVVIKTTEKKTLWESYNDLSKEQKEFFDGLRKAAIEKEGSREYESSAQLSYVLFKDNLVRLRIRRDTVEAVFMLMDSTFKQATNADMKIKETKTVVKIENQDYYALALETLERKYNLIQEQKAEREEKKRLERLEKARQKRLNNK